MGPTAKSELMLPLLTHLCAAILSNNMLVCARGGHKGRKNMELAQQGVQIQAVDCYVTMWETIMICVS